MVSLLLATGLTFLPFSQVQPGQRGFCITEWSQGQKIHIPVEVVGTLPSPQPGRRAVLIKLEDPRFADSGVVAGMSGSPVYVEGKLLGALAFGWSFAREPLAGVTPFEDMQAIPVEGSSSAPTPPTPTPGGSSSRNPLASGEVPPQSLAPHPLELLVAALRGDLEPSSLAPKLSPSGPVLPLSVSGLSDPGWNERLWRPLGLTPVPGGTEVATEEGDEEPPQPGDMVAAVLVWGDAVLASGGTLTAREGDTFFAFGHPFFASGAVKMPAARARVLAIQSSYALAFKIFNVGDTFGTFVADQPAGMVAVRGQAPEGLPVTVAIKGAGESKRFSFFLADVPILKPLLAAFVTGASLAHNQGTNADLTIGLSFKAHFGDGRTVNLQQLLAGSDAVGKIATFVGTLVNLLVSPPFPAPGVAAVEMELTRSPHASATILEVFPQHRKVRPGEELAVTVRLQPRHGPAEERRYTVTIPSYLPPGKLDLIVADGVTFSDYALRSEKAAAEDFSQLCTLLSRLEPSSHLVLALETREGGLSLQKGALPALPPSLAASYASALAQGNSERLSTHLVVSQRSSFPWPLAGGLRVNLEVLPPEAP